MSATTHVIRAQLNWAKVFGKPQLNTYTEKKEWSVDAVPYAEKDMEEIKRLGLDKKLREPKNGGKKFLSFKRPELNKDGEPNDPIDVVGVDGSDWNPKDLLGNGTIADIKFRVVDYGKGFQKGMYIQTIRVLDRVKYQKQEFAPLSEDDEFFSQPEETPVAENETVESDSLDDIPE